MMGVVFDAAKNVINIRKHGISLQRAEDLDFATALIRVDDREDYGEVRYRAIGWLDGKLFGLIFTYSEETIRAISLRNATKQERENYVEEN